MSTLQGLRRQKRIVQICLLAAFAGALVAVGQVPATGPATDSAAVRARITTVGQNPTGKDWAYLAQYHDANAALPPPGANENRVVFMGDSITQMWAQQPLFQNKSYVGRGIGGQTTPQMLVRFRQDVIDLHPKVVVIMAGTNDIAGNTGLLTPAMIEENFKSMAELAQVNHIKVVLCSVTPCYQPPTSNRPESLISDVNTRLKDYAAKKGLVYADFHTPMADANGSMKREYSGDGDGVHPNAAGFAVMGPIVEKAIAQALAMK